MCGITGFISTRQSAESAEVLRDMLHSIHHRGPDSTGIWQDKRSGLNLGHARLSIIDLSPAGQQPMASACGRYVLVYNGEIYNHHELRATLEQSGNAPEWRGHSDTETLLAGFQAWGVRETLQRAVGMFALALWDRETAELSLARDRMGEKPLYFGRQGGSFLFGSELKALCQHPDWAGEIDRGALALQLRHNCIPAPYSIYRGIAKLNPGHLLQFSLEDWHSGADLPASVAFWDMRGVAQAGLDAPFTGGPDEAVDRLEKVLGEAVAGQMMADVPLGAFLSGGIDSSAVVAMMQSHSSRPVRTFSIGFHEQGYNEAEHAKAVAKHLGTEHTELYVTPQEAQAVIPGLPAIYDEPFSDSSQIPTLLVSQLARRHVTVSLSGDGGDELFGGYNRYLWTKRLWKRLGWAPRGARVALGTLIEQLSPAGWNSLFQSVGRVLPAGWRHVNPGEKLHKLASVLPAHSPEGIYWALVSHWKEPQQLVRNSVEPPTALTSREHWLRTPDIEQQMMYLDAITYLPDDILVKVDRAAMAVSLETRVPMLDHRVVEFAWQLPLSMKIREGQSKWPLRQLLYRHVPKSLIERPKMGFGVPLDHWLRGPLRDWAEVLLDERRLRDEGFFDPQPIRHLWAEHLSGRRNAQHHLWDVLMFQGWLEQQRAGANLAISSLSA